MIDEANKVEELRIALGSENEARLEGVYAILFSMKGTAPDRDSPVREIPARLGDRWSALLLMILETGQFRHAELKRAVSILSSEQAISQRILTLRLRALERDGFVNRKITGANPPRVDYSLTPLGRDLTERLIGFIRWIENKSDEVIAARTLFEKQQS